MIVLDGKATAATIRAELKEKVSVLAQQHGRVPGLAVVLAGDDPASQVYVRMKHRACEEIGIKSFSYTPDSSLSQEGLMELIDSLNANSEVDGILVQLPLPEGLDEFEVIQRIDPGKDVDGFNPENVGRLSIGLEGYRPCTPQGCIELLRRYDLSPAGKHAVVVGRSNIVGKPLAMLLGLADSMGNATVTMCHSRTPDLKAEVLRADYVFAAIGRPKFITGDMVKEGAVVVDVGINRTDEGLVGDCDYDAMKDKVAAITPVPGGVGPMTIAQLMLNTVQAFEQHVK